MNKRKSLQKLTSIDKILEQDIIEKNQYDTLSENDQKILIDKIESTLTSLKGTKRDNFIKKIYPILNESTRNSLWESNNAQIYFHIYKTIKEKNRLPTKIEISENTGLSRQTIHKHLNEMKSNEQYQQELTKFQMLKPLILSKVFNLAINGNLLACRIFLQSVNNTFEPEQTINNNNFIQINGITINQEFIQKLDNKKCNNLIKILTG